MIKEKKERIYKCTYCKCEIEPDELIQWESGVKTITKKRAHKNCRQNAIDRKEFYNVLWDILDSPAVEGNTIYTKFESLHKSGFSWSVMTHAIKNKAKAISEGFSKGWGYTIAIIQNQLPHSFREVQKQKERILSEEKETNIINIDNLSSKKFNTTDYSNIFD